MGREIKNIVLAGAGMMSASIAQIFAEKGYGITIYNRSESGIERCRQSIAVNRETLIAAGEFTEEENRNIVEKIQYATAVDIFKGADLVIESIVEDMDTKKKFWAEISAVVKEDAVLTTNTSGLSITEMAQAVVKPERFLGFHWVNPPHIIPLVEIISGEKTDEAFADLVYTIAENIGKKPIRVKDALGFCLNRFQYAIVREAMHIVEKGIASMEDVDKAFKYGLGLRYACLGPLEVMDMGGLDTFYKISCYLNQDLSDEKGVSPILTQCFKEGRYGVKNGRGFYDYGDGRDKEAIKIRDEKYIKVVKAVVD